MNVPIAETAPIGGIATEVSVEPASSWVEWFQALPPLVASDDVWTLGAITLTGVALSIYLEQTYRWAAKLSGPVLCLLAAMAMTNLKIMPAESSAYDLVDGYLVPVAIPLLLFRADVFRIVRTTGSMFVAFHVSVLGTMLGAMLAAVLFMGVLDQVPEVTGIMTGSYTGGAVNFFAVKGSFDVSDNLTNPLLVADNFIMAGMFIALLGIAASTFFRRRYPHSHSAEEDLQQSRSLAARYWKPKEVSLLDVAKSLAIAVAIAAVSLKLSGWIDPETDAPDGGTLVREIVGNKFVLITFFSVLTATLLRGRLEKIGGAEELGAWLLYVFFFRIGLPADLVTVVTNVPMMFLFCLVIAVVNLAVTLGLGKLLRLNLEELVLCVNATLGGAPSAAAMAIAKGWPKLVLPALLVGIWGYVIGTFLGVLVGKTLIHFLR